VLGEVVPARRVDVRERGVAAPILRGTVGGDDLRQVAGGGESIEQPARAPGQRIGRHHVGKRKDVTPQRCCLV
jgi:hypothetical protein